MNSRNFFAELKRRHVYNVAVAYAVVAWLLIQVATQVFPFFGIPNWAVRLVVLLSILGFPVALILSWAFEITPEGIKRAEDVAPNESIRRQTGRKIVGITVALALIAAGLFLFRLWQTKAMEGPITKPAATASAIPAKSIAVLPFENLSADKANAYFAEGIQDEILMRLTNITELKVISRTSTQRFKSSPDNVREIAQQLGVANILEGSVQRTADQVRVNVQLINAQKDTHLWAESYDRRLTDIFAVEGEIARNVAEMLQAKLTGSAERLLASRPTENPEAHQFYLKGKFYDARGTEADYRKAIDFYKAAIRLDPRYALAYTGLSIEWINLARKFLSGAEAQQAYTDARAAADAALALEPNLAAAHRVRGTLLESADFDWNGAQAEYRRALQLTPNDAAARGALGALMAILGHPDQAVELVRQELTSDPLCASCYNWLSTYLSPLGRLDEAEQAIRSPKSMPCVTTRTRYSNGSIAPGLIAMQASANCFTIRSSSATSMIHASSHSAAKFGYPRRENPND